MWLFGQLIYFVLVLALKKISFACGNIGPLKFAPSASLANNWFYWVIEVCPAELGVECEVPGAYIGYNFCPSSPSLANVLLRPQLDPR